MRSLSHNERHARREEVIRLRSDGLTFLQIATRTGLSRTGVFGICKRFDAMGQVGLRDKPNGHMTGHGRLLLPVQESLVCRLIAEQTPDQLSLAGPLWTPAEVAQLIVERLGIVVQRRAMRLYLARWGYVRHARMEHAMAHLTPALRHWLEHDLPAIESRARLEGAEVHWSHDDAMPCAPERQELPDLQKNFLMGVGGPHAEALVLSTVTNKGSRCWMTLQGPLDDAACIDFLRRLTKGRDHKIFLMLDLIEVHPAQAVAAWLAEHDELVEVFSLPGQHDVQVRPDRSHGALLTSFGDSKYDC